MSDLRIGSKVTVTAGIYPRVGTIVGRAGNRWKVLILESKIVRFVDETELDAAPESSANIVVRTG